MNRLYLLPLSLAIVTAGSAADNSPAITIDSVSLSTSSLLQDWTSNEPANRERARIYLLGVLDATEGTYWCDYRTLKTVSIRDWVFDHLRKLPDDRRSERASNIIIEALRTDFPCRNKERK